MKTALEALDLGLAQAAGTVPAPAEPAPTEEVETPLEGAAPESTEVSSEKDKGEISPEGAKEAPEGEKPEETPEQKAEREAAEAAKAAETPEQKAERETAEAAKAAEKAAKPIDPLKDPIHGNVTERTRGRITTLIDMVKERDAKITEHQELVNHIQSTGASPDEFARLLGYSRMVHSNNLDDKRTAYQVLLSELKGLAPQIGETLPGMDPLDDHKDLQDAVAAQQMGREHAIELAQARTRGAAATRATETRTAEQIAEQEFETARRTGMSDLDALETQLRKDDPQYEAKKAMLLPILKPAMQRLHPSRWKDAFTDAFRGLVLPAAPAVVAPIVKTNGQQPLRANKQPSGQGAKQPTTALEALNAGLESLKG